MQNLTIGLIRKIYLLKAHARRRGQLQRGGTGAIFNFSLALHEHKHLVQVGQTLLDLTVQHPKKTQRNIKLDHERVDHDQVTQGQRTGHHTCGCSP